MKLYIIASLFVGLLSGSILAQVTSNTTDDDNVTTTTVVETTTNLVETTTNLVETTTNLVETTTVTVRPTTPPPTPAPSKKPERGKWVLKEGKNVCVRLDAAIQLYFKYEQTNKKYVEAYLNVPPANTTVDDEKSSCELHRLSLSFNDTSLSLTFALENEKVFLKEANLTYVVSKEIFPGAEDLGEKYTKLAENLTLFQVSDGKSYVCKEASKINFIPNITVTFTDIQAEAFFKNNTSEDFSSAEECSADKISDIVPIAVGCALAALVIIVLIAYLVGRQRTRQRGYQSV